MGIVQEIEHFGEYFSKGMTSSAIGGLFNAIPYFIYMIYIWLIDKRYKKRNPDYVDDKKYALLSKLSYFCIIFIPASFFVQVLGHRYVFPFLIVWMIFFLYTIRNEPPNKRFISFFIAAFVHILVAFAIYILPYYVLGESFYVDELLKVLKSIKYFEYLDFFKD